MKSPARSFARAFLVGVVALIPAVMIARPASSGDNGPAAQAAGRDELFRPGAVRTFEGRALAEVAFPLGGIGTGTVSLGGRGNLRDWEIFNRPGKGVHMPFTFFALYCEQGGTKRVRVLEGPLEPPFTTGFGFRRVYVPGPAAHGEGPLQGRIPVRRGRALRSARSRSRSPSRPSIRSSPSRPTTPASRPSSCATG